MERSKQARGSSTEKLALVKAAAWAWYQHGSGSEAKPIREYDMRRTCHTPQPSRYKLESMKNIAKQGTTNVVADDDDHHHHSLLDTYEIESIARQLDQLIESSGDKEKLYKGFLVGDDHRAPGTKEAKWTSGVLRCEDKSSLPLKLQTRKTIVADVPPQENGSLLNGNRNIHERKKKSKNYYFKGFWQRHAVICGSREDVVETKAFVGSRRPEKRLVYIPAGSG